VSTLPSGTVTLLFTDIEGSTRLLHELGDHYPDALAEHRRLLREAFAVHGGVEVDTQGDAFFVAFARASDALAAADRGQRALASGPVRVRMGLHTGEPVLTEEGYVGADVHRAARVAAAANGGQVLISAATRELLGDDAEVRDLGAHRLKDFDVPSRLFQLGAREFPPLRTPDVARLPLTPSPLVGRKKELAEALRAIRAEQARLLTISGAGGVGKTRFAVEVATELLNAFTDGVRFVDLAPVRSADAVPTAIAQAVRARGPLRAALADRELLLLLDNVEHVAAASTELASLIELCPGVSLLVTSREPLHLRLERELPLSPMPEAPAVELFRQRSRMLDPEFEGEYPLLAEICSRLDGLPLAIELAAARVKVLGPTELLERLERRLPLLSGRNRDVPERQRTLRATIDWSHELLDDGEQRIFAALSVFVGGFTVEAAEKVADADIDAIESLVAKSLVRQERGRLSMLEIVREYAVEQLEATEAASGVRRRHAEYYLGLAERAEPELRRTEQARWLDRLTTEYPNIRAALEWAATADPDVELRLAASLEYFWRVRGNASEGLSLIEGALVRGGDHPARLRALSAGAILAGFSGRYQRATELADEELALAREVGDDRLLGVALCDLGFTLVSTDTGRAQMLLEESRARFAAAADESGLARALNNLSMVSFVLGDVPASRRLADESLVVARRAGDERAICAALLNAAQSAKHDEALEDARAFNREAVRRSSALGYGTVLAFALEELASLGGDLGASDAARLLGAAEALRERIASFRTVAVERELLARMVEDVRTALGAEQFAAAWAEGRGLRLEDAVRLALGSVD
jgi:predicted ATPase/class 3 adenylate cyclase